LNLEQARELGRGNAIHQLQQNYQALSVEVNQITTDLREVLAHLREDPGGGRRRTPSTPRNESPCSHSSSCQEDPWPSRERSHPRQQVDDLRDMKFDPPKFEAT